MRDALPKQMHIVVNGAPRALPPNASVAALLQNMGLAKRRLAVAVNRKVTPRAKYAAAVLHAGDRVEILEAVGGG